MKKLSKSSFIDTMMFFYILSLYLFTYRENLFLISNIIGAILVISIWLNFLLTKRKFVFNKVLFTYLLFIVICLISAFFALDQSISISKIKTLILIFIFMISFINYIDTVQKLKKIINYFVYSGFIASIYMLVNSDFSRITRFGEELGNVNAVGMIIGISVTFSFYILLTKKKYTHIFFILIMIITILLTGSRKSLLFIFINMIIVIYLRNRKSFKAKFKFILSTILILMILYYLVFNIELFYQIVGKRIENMFDFVLGEGTNEGSLNMRAYMIKVGIDMFKSNPVIGYGIDNYRVLFNVVPGGRETYAHNNYIELMVGTGIFGVVIYYITHIFVLNELFKNYRHAYDKTIYFTFIAIIVSYIILSFSLVYYDNKHFNFLLAIASIINKVNEFDKSDKCETN